MLNFRRKSTDGVSILFFLFACLGNLTYVMSILAFEGECSGATASGSGKNKGGGNECAPGEAAHIYWEYILVNLSWLAGSAGTLLLDFAIFVQFFLYNKSEDEDEYEDEDEEYDDDEEEEESVVDESESIRRANRGRRSYFDERPVLDRGLSDV